MTSEKLQNASSAQSEAIPESSFVDIAGVDPDTDATNSDTELKEESEIEIISIDRQNCGSAGMSEPKEGQSKKGSKSSSVSDNVTTKNIKNGSDSSQNRSNKLAIYSRGDSCNGSGMSVFDQMVSSSKPNPDNHWNMDEIV